MTRAKAAEVAHGAGARLLVKRVPLDSLHPDPSNARMHGPENLDAIVASLRRWGQAEPIVVQAGTGRIVGGNGRYIAMRKLGWTEVDVVELNLTDLDATSLGIALNRSAELAGWDNAVLAKLLDELRAENALDGVGYSTEQIDSLIAELAEAAGPAELDDPGPEAPPPNPASRAGDLWILGEHRLLCGDSTKVADVERLLAGARPRLFSTDAPYCVEYTGNNRPIHEGKSSGKDWSFAYREIDIKDFGEFLDSVLTAWLPRIEEDAPLYLWHAHVQQHRIVEVFDKHDVLFHQVIVWVKPTPVFTHCYYQWQHEPCAFGWKRGNKPKHGVAQHSTVWQVDWEGKARIVGNEHPTQKPLRLFELPMELHTKRGDVVAEPFCGSGSQMIGAERQGRRCYGMEISPPFVDVIIRRWQKATGKHATLDGDGRTFEAIAGERRVT